VELTVSISASGDDPAVGAVINYTITIRNDSPYPVTDLIAWDTLPANLLFLSSDAGVIPSINGQTLIWDFTGQTLAAHQEIRINYTVEITVLVEGDLISTTAWVDYYDQHYTSALGRHPAIPSSVHFYPEGQAATFPNPFNPDRAKDGLLKFINVTPGSLITIYTVSGEMVASIDCKVIRAEWNGKNNRGSRVSPGVYFYIIKNLETGKARRGKIFIVKN
jgi:uncharacterized repeat protein (TIGR01451 family)